MSSPSRGSIKMQPGPCRARPGQQRRSRGGNEGLELPTAPKIPDSGREPAHRFQGSGGSGVQGGLPQIQDPWIWPGWGGEGMRDEAAAPGPRRVIHHSEGKKKKENSAFVPRLGLGFPGWRQGGIPGIDLFHPCPELFQFWGAPGGAVGSPSGVELIILLLELNNY